MNQPVRWQHLVVFAALVGLFSGAVMFLIGISGSASDRAAPASVGAAVFLASAAVGGFALWSLRKALARAALAARLARGLFHLPANAPAPLVDLNAALPRHFGLTPTYLKVSMPATFGELVAATAELARTAGTISPDQHDAARQALASAVGQTPVPVSWGTRLADLFPAGRQRYVQWERLRAAAPLLPEVTLNPWVENIAIYGFLAALIAIAVPIAQKLDANQATRVPDTPGTRLVGKAFGLVLFAGIIGVLMIPVYAIGRKYAARLPAEVETVGALAPFFPSVAFPKPWMPHIVAGHLRELAAHHLGMRPDDIGGETPIYRAPGDASRHSHRE